MCALLHASRPAWAGQRGAITSELPPDGACFGNACGTRLPATTADRRASAAQAPRASRKAPVAAQREAATMRRAVYARQVRSLARRRNCSRGSELGTFNGEGHPSQNASRAGRRRGSTLGARPIEAERQPRLAVAGGAAELARDRVATAHVRGALRARQLRQRPRARPRSVHLNRSEHAVHERCGEEKRSAQAGQGAPHGAARGQCMCADRALAAGRSCGQGAAESASVTGEQANVGVACWRVVSRRGFACSAGCTGVNLLGGSISRSCHLLRSAPSHTGPRVRRSRGGLCAARVALAPLRASRRVRVSKTSRRPRAPFRSVCPALHRANGHDARASASWTCRGVRAD